VKLWGNEFLSGEKCDLLYQLEMANTQKTAIVTGGSQGIGAGLVKAFLDRGPLKGSMKGDTNAHPDNTV